MAGVDEPGNYDEACGEHGSDSVTSFWNIKTCTLQGQLNLSYGNVQYYNEHFASDWGFGCVLMPNGQAVLCNGIECSVKILDKVQRKSVVTDIPLKCPEGYGKYKPYDIARLDKNRVIISVPSAKVLQPILIIPHVQLEKQMNLKIVPYNLVCYNNKIYVSTDDLNEWACFVCGGIQVLAQNGDVLQNIQLFQRPRLFCVDNNGVVLVDTVKSKTSLANTRHLSVPRLMNRVIIDDESNIMLSSCDEVLVVKTGGTETKTLVKEQNPPNQQQSPNTRIAFSYNPSGDRLLCYTAFLAGDNQGTQNDYHTGERPPYICYIQFTCQMYELDM